MSQKISEVSEKAQSAFWEVVTKEFPEVKHVNFTSDQTMEFNNACEQVIYDWLKDNYPIGAKRFSLLL